MGISELLAAKQKELLEARFVERAKVQSAFPGNSLLWAALGPVWTATLARLAGFPTGGQDVAELLDEIAARGFTAKVTAAPELRNDEHGTPKLTTGEDLYAAGEQSVREIVESTPDVGERAKKIRECITKICEGLRGAQRHGSVLPGRIVNWLELAEQLDKWPSAKDTLLARVDDCLSKGDEAGAVAWVEAAFPLEKALAADALLGGDIALGVKLAGLRVQLHQRRASNERYLQRFLQREAQVQAFRELLSDAGDHWALHYAGSGGVGKTMLVRHLESRAAPQEGVSTARVDFDYLNPEYPTSKPALLVLQFAGELRLADKTGKAANYFQSFFDRAKTLHERLAGQAGPIGTAPVDEPEFQSLLQMFAFAVQQIPGRVVLILDTCEELAKMKADGSPQDAVEVTFKVLGQLHVLVPSLRVVLCGRRPLASQGAGWECIRGADKEGLPERPYLRLHEIRSFTANEARQYLMEREECRAELVQPILPHCKEKGYAPLFSNSSVSAEERYSPFDLSLYATWVKGEPEVTPGEVESTTLDQYVRTRIVGRIQNTELRALIPAIAWVGLVDQRAMEALAGLEEGSARAAQLSAEMERQEWVAGSPAGGFLVPPEMRRRLLDYYAENDRSAYDQGRGAAADYLSKALPATPVRQMQVVHLEAALEALQPEPERAAAWWKAIDERIMSEEAWDWILAPTLRLLADEHWHDAVCKGKHIRAAIAATRAAALVQTEDMPKALETSRIMLADAANYPDAAEGTLLAATARALWGDSERDDPMTEEVGAAAITGVEWALAQPEPPSQKQAEECIELINKFDKGRVCIEQQAYGLVLGGRIFAAYDAIKLTVGDNNLEKLCFQSAFGLATRFEMEPSKRRWRFWKPPQDLAARLRLEFLRWAWPNGAGPTQLEWWLSSPDHIANADSDRLAAAVLGIRAAQRTPNLEKTRSSLVPESREVFGSNPRLLPVHRHFPPYFAVAAEEMAYAGSVEEALDLLRYEVTSSESMASTFQATLDVDGPLTRVISRYRLVDEGVTPSETLEFAGDLKGRASVWGLRALGGHPPEFRPDDLDSPARIHARWSTCIACDAPAALHLLEWAGQAFASLPAEPGTFDELSCRLDLLEANELAERFGLPPVNRKFGLARRTKLPSTPEADFEIALRMWAMGIDRQPKPGLVQRIGTRRAAAIALELGELLALRVPVRAQRMLRFARQYFRMSGDPMRMTMASVCLALASARAGKREDLESEVKILRALFERQRNAVVNPDTWKAVETAVTRPEANPGIEVWPGWMRPWMLRTSMSLALARDGSADGQHCHNVRQVWLRIARHLPPEGMIAERNVQMAVPQSRQPRDDGPPMSMEEPVPAPRARRTPILTIKCLDQAGRMAPGMRMQLSRELDAVSTATGSLVLEVKTPAPTDPYASLAPVDSTELHGVQLCVVDRNSAWVAWEAILDPSGENFVSRRTSSAQLPVPNLMNWDKPSYHTLTMHHAGADLGGSAFGTTKRWRYTTVLERVADGAEPGTIQILHVVSDVVDTSGGVRLSFQSEREGQRGRVIRADELTKLLPDIRVYVLQLPVALNDGKRDGVCREKAALLRAFAAQLQLASEQIVITLPGLRFREGQVLLQAIMAGVEAPQPTAAMSIFGELKKVRAHLFQTLPPDEAEAGFDICYFG
jgi:hypothetical protein